jgi:hypothetical protein
MPYSGGSLADGQLPSSVGAIYTATAVKAVIKAVTLHNTNVTTQTINIYITRSGSTRRQLYRFAGITQFQSMDVLSDGETWTLSAGDTIDADTTTAAAVDFTILGATE